MAKCRRLLLVIYYIWFGLHILNWSTNEEDDAMTTAMTKKDGQKEWEIVWLWERVILANLKCISVFNLIWTKWNEVNIILVHIAGDPFAFILKPLFKFDFSFSRFLSQSYIHKNTRTFRPAVATFLAALQKWVGFEEIERTRDFSIYLQHSSKLDSFIFRLENFRTLHLS